MSLVDLENIVIVNLTNTKDLPVHKYAYFSSKRANLNSLNILDLTIMGVPRESASATPFLTCVNIPPVTITSSRSAPTFCLPRHSQSIFSGTPLQGWSPSIEVFRDYWTLVGVAG